MTTSLPSKAYVFSGDYSNLTPLKSAVYGLNAKARQAFFGAGRRNGTIARGTWNGCAFNQGGQMIGQIVSSYDAAAKAFGLTEFAVVKFIHAWDGTAKREFTDAHGKTWNPNPDYCKSDEKATKALLEIIELAGLFVDQPNIRVRVYDAQELAEIDQFKTELDHGMIVEGLLEVERALCLV